MTSNLNIEVGPVRLGNTMGFVSCGVLTQEVGTGETVYIPCKREVKGRGLRIGTTEKTLVLCEVAIYGTQG